MPLAFVLTVSLVYPWGGDPEASVSPDLWIGDDPQHSAILSPLELTWSPEAGFGARSSVVVTQPVAQP